MTRAHAGQKEISVHRHFAPYGCAMGRGQGNRSDFGLTRWQRQGVDGRIGQRVLGRLGIDVDAPVTRTHRRYEVFLPEASNSGYYSFLATAQPADEPIWTPAQELRWLAEHLRLRAPGPRNPSWRQTWNAAISQAGVDSAPQELDFEGRVRFVERLADPVGYSRLIVDALAEAFNPDGGDQPRRAP